MVVFEVVLIPVLYSVSPMSRATLLSKPNCRYIVFPAISISHPDL